MIIFSKFDDFFSEKESIETHFFSFFSNFRTSWQYSAHKKNYGLGGLGWVYGSCDQRFLKPSLNQFLPLTTVKFEKTNQRTYLERWIFAGSFMKPTSSLKIL